MIKDNCSRPPGGAAAPALSLQAIWDVEADLSYNVYRRREPGNVHIAVRTHSGEGEIMLKGMSPLRAGRKALLIFRDSDLMQYRCAADRWNFWWFQFEVTGAFDLPLNLLMDIPASDDEYRQFKHIFDSLHHDSETRRSYASSLFTTLLYEWVLNSGASLADSPSGMAIEQAMAIMHENLGTPLAIKYLAMRVGMSERAFRNAFARITGKSPKHYYNDLRTGMASELLRMGLCNVGEAADRLGFSSPFHFSKEFKKRFGYAPSKVKCPASP